jgi:hypothetical protein
VASIQRNIFYERMMALIAAANLGLVAFDLSYVPWRNFWLQHTIQFWEVRIPVPLPPITKLYDPIKGIQPHRETETYLETLNRLDQELQQNGIDSPPVQARLQELRDRSSEMIATNPFSSANKSGTLEKIKNRMRDRVYGKENQEASSRQAFATFWTADYLKQKGVQSELTFFKNDIQRLVETNYFRSIGENGDPTNLFFILDAPFVALFGFELFVRSFFISRRNKVKWLDAVLWRWYDLLLLIPVWQFLRIIPVAIRLDHGKLIRLAHIRDQATQGFVANIAGELTEAVITEALSQVQVGLQRGGLARRLVSAIDKPYVDLNDKDEIQELVSQVLKLTVYQVLPKIKPDLEAVLRHPIEAVLEKAPGYNILKSVPLMGTVPNQINQQAVAAATETAYQALIVALEDKVAAQLISQLIRSFGQVLVQELQKGKTLEEIQDLLNELIEEVKVNYVNSMSQDEVEVVINPGRSVKQIGSQS